MYTKSFTTVLILASSGILLFNSCSKQVEESPRIKATPLSLSTTHNNDGEIAIFHVDEQAVSLLETLSPNPKDIATHSRESFYQTAKETVTQYVSLGYVVESVSYVPIDMSGHMKQCVFLTKELDVKYDSETHSQFVIQ